MEMKNFSGKFTSEMNQLFSFSLIISSWCQLLEEACIETVDSQKMTKDLAICIHGLKKYEL